MNELVLPLMAAVLIEAIVHYTHVAQIAIKEKTIDWRIIAAPVGGVAFAVIYGQDLFVEYTATIPYISSVFTGIVFARLANVSNDFVGLIRK